MSLSLSLLKAKEEPIACFLSIFAVVLWHWEEGEQKGDTNLGLPSTGSKRTLLKGFASRSRGVTIEKQSRATSWVPVAGATP